MEPLYQLRGETWLADEMTQGPLPGFQHAGALGGLMAAGMEELASENGAGVPLMFSMVVMSPPPIAPAERTAAVVRGKGRMGVYTGSIAFEGKVSATATLVCAHPVPVDTLPPLPAGKTDPAVFERDNRFDDWPTPMYGHAIEFRMEPGGPYWLRPTRPLFNHPTPAMAQVAAMADFAPGVGMFTSKTNWRGMVRAFPTLDLTVHLARPLEGEWIGIHATNIWYDNGLGLTESALYDVRGPLGRCAQSFVVIPKEK